MKQRIGIDLGKKSIKYCTPNKVDEIPSYLSPGKLSGILLGDSSPTISVCFDGVDYVVGEDATLCRGFSWKKDEVKGEVSNLIYLLAVLGREGITDADIMVGLPVSTFDKEKDLCKHIFSGSKEAVVNGHRMVFNLATRVTREPLGSYCQLILNHDGSTNKTSPYYERSVAIIDAGHRTLDIILVKQGKLTEVAKSSMAGTTVLFDQLWTIIEKEHGMLRPSEMVEIFTQITQNKDDRPPLIKGDLSPSIASHVKRLKKELASEVHDFTKSVLAEISPSITVMTGGGALFLKEELQALNRSAVFHPNARFANCIGFYRLLTKVCNAEKNT